MAGVSLQLRHAYSTAQFVPTVSSPSPPPIQRVRFGTSPSRVIFCNLRANSAAAPTLRTTRRSETIAASSVSSSVDSNSLVEDRDDVSRIPLLEVRDLRAVIAESRQEILKGVNLVVYEGEVHAVMGKNGSGKSTFSKVLVGHPDYEVTGGSIVFKGQNLLDMEPEERSLAGLFMSFQSPVEIPGVSNMDFLNMAFNARKRKLGQPELDPIQFYSHLVSKLEVVNMKTDFLNRNVNEGFSGGERKRNEILQLANKNSNSRKGRKRKELVVKELEGELVYKELEEKEAVGYQLDKLTKPSEEAKEAWALQGEGMGTAWEQHGRSCTVGAAQPLHHHTSSLPLP